MRVLIDLQSSQGESRFCEIGRYSIEISKHLINLVDEVYILLNDAFPRQVLDIKKKFKLSEENYITFSPLKPVSFLYSPSFWRIEISEMVREYVIAEVEPDVVFVTSVFEGLGDDIVVSIKKFKDTNTVATLYDLIPLIYNEYYLTDKKIKKWYFYRLNQLRASDGFVAISEGSKKEGIKYLNLNSNDVCIAYPAPSEIFRVLKEPDLNVPKKYGIFKKFILYVPGGYDFRKNIESLIIGFGKLPRDIKNKFQIVVCGKIDEINRKRHIELAKKVGVDLILTGYVEENELVNLYNLCELFVHPSLHEGFGIPVVEAMACGAPVIGSNATGIAEIINREDAIFNPRDPDSIAKKILEVLNDEELKEELRKYGLKRSKDFSWEKSAKNISNFLKRFKKVTSISNNYRKLRLAYISPFPPQESGIGYYIKELVPELSKYYEIELIVNQCDISDEYLKANFPVRNVEYFVKNFKKYDRVLYHLGNSEFHQYMLDLLNDYPGVVVLHDFFLSGLIGWINQYDSNFMVRNIFLSHGYKGLIDLKKNQEKCVWEYPMNLKVLQNALGIIIHSEHALDLAKEFYFIKEDKFCIIPLLQKIEEIRDKKDIKKELGYDEKFLICSFGIVGKTKMTDLIVEAFLSSSLLDKNCLLIIVGKIPKDVYGELTEKIEKSKGKILVTGWVDEETWKKYLQACDLAVQLRTFSRGEAPKTLFDCLAFGIPTIANDHGSIKYLPNDVVYKLPEEVTKEDLRKALEKLYEDESLRIKLSFNARKYVEENLDPRRIAKKFYDAIEMFYTKVNDFQLIEQLSKFEIPRDDRTIWEISEYLENNFPASPKQRKILVDISQIVRTDYQTGIQRVVKSILYELLLITPKKFRVEAVYLDDNFKYRYARKWVASKMALPNFEDEPVVFEKGDVLLLLDLFTYEHAHKRDIFWQIKARGSKIVSMVYDILPLKRSDWFVPGMGDWFKEYIKTIAEISDKIICISRSTLEDLHTYLKNSKLMREDLKISYIHLGVEIDRFGSSGLPENWIDLIKIFNSKPTFLMVGTIEPRKGHKQTLEAFELLWKEGYDLNLVIVGKEGWMVEDIIKKIKNHSELNKRLFWLKNVSDEFLDKIYRNSTALIMASEDEGFGLPIVEAAYRKLPLIARDIKVFREIAGDGAYYFKGEEPRDLAKALKIWLDLYKNGGHPKPDKIKFLSWKEVAQMILSEILHTIS
ncbi:MAG: glycosyltransferase [Candidatus Aenigmatarchaeota archaeon]